MDATNGAIGADVPRVENGTEYTHRINIIEHAGVGARLLDASYTMTHNKDGGQGAFNLHTIAAACYTFQCGWPFPSFRTTTRNPAQTNTWTPAITVPDWLQTGYSLGGGIRGARPLPLDPLPAGFAINTAFYILCTSLLFIVYPACRTARRRRHGRCPRCAYDVTGLDTCPECGTVVSGTAHASRRRHSVNNPA